MSEFGFDALGEEVMTAAFEDAWRTDLAEVDGSRTYPVNATRLMFEAAGVSWQTVAKASTRGYEAVTGESINR